MLCSWAVSALLFIHAFCLLAGTDLCPKIRVLLNEECHLKMPRCRSLILAGGGGVSERLPCFRGKQGHVGSDKRHRREDYEGQKVEHYFTGIPPTCRTVQPQNDRLEDRVSGK